MHISNKCISSNYQCIVICKLHISTCCFSTYFSIIFEDPNSTSSAIISKGIVMK